MQDVRIAQEQGFAEGEILFLKESFFSLRAAEIF